MKDAMHKDESVVTQRRLDEGKQKKRRSYCAVCACRIWFGPVHISEPEGVPEPRRSWTLCKECQGALVAELRRSPVRSLVRLRIAMGIIASGRSPHSYLTQHQQTRRDYRWVIFIAAGTFIAMILHLVLIVLIAGFH